MGCSSHLPAADLEIYTLIWKQILNIYYFLVGCQLWRPLSHHNAQLYLAIKLGKRERHTTTYTYIHIYMEKMLLNDKLEETTKYFANNFIKTLSLP